MATSAEELRARLLRARLQAARDKSAQPSDVDTSPFPLPRSPNATGVPSAYKGSKTALAAAGAGVDVTSGAPTGRLQTGFAQNLALQAEDLEKRLSEHFGEPVQMRIGPESKQLEFLNPRTKRFTLVDEAGFTLRDLSEMAGPAITGAGAVAGEFVAGPPGAAAGGAAGEAARRVIGQKMGVRDETAEETVKGALGSGAVEGVASGVGNVVARTAQGVRNLVRPRVVTPKEAERILSQSAANQAIADEISARTQMRLQPFTGQMAEDPLLLAEQSRVMSSRESGVEARAQQRQNETVLERFFDVVNPSGGGPRTAVGRAIQTEARSQTQPRVEAIEAGVQRQVAELESLTSALPRAQNQQMGAQLRQMAEEARASVKGAEDAAWDAVRRGYAFNPDTALSGYQVPVSGELETTLKRLQTEAKEALDPSIAAGKKQLATDRLLPSGEELTDADKELLGAFNILADDKHSVDLHQVQVLLQHLRKRERISRQNVVATDPGGRDISRVRDALVTARNDYLRSVDPELLAEIEAAEALTATRANLFDKGVVGGLLRRVDGQYVLTDSEVVGRTIGSGNPEAITHLVNVLGAHPAGVPALQGAMLAFYRNEVVRDGLPKAELHRRFIENHGEALDALFPRDAAKVRQLGELEKVATKNIGRFETFKKRVEQSFRGRIQDLAPERIAEQVLSNSFSVKDVSRLAALSKLAGVHDTYQRAIGDQIRRRLMSQTSGLNLNSLDKFVEQNGEKLTAVFGEQYIRDMRLLAKALKTVQTDTGGIAVTRKPTLMEAVARSTVARPLSAPGVALTRAMRFRQAAAERAVAKAVMDPQTLHEIIRQGDADVTSRQVAQLLAVIGASTLATEMEESE